MNNITEMASALFLFYLLVSSGYIHNLFGCRTQELFTNNMIIKHVIGIITLYISIVLTLSNDFSPIQGIIVTLILYIWFLLTTRCDRYFFIAVLFCISIAFFIKQYRNYYYKHNIQKKRKLKHFEFFMYITSIILTFIGCIIYLGEKKLQLKNKFSYKDFIIGKTNCNFDRSVFYNKHSYFTYFMSAFT